MEIAQRLSRISESQTIRMSKLGRELRAQGIDIIDLSIGEPDFDTPVHIKEAAKKAIDDGYTHYTPVPGYLDLRQAICAKLQRDNGVDYTPDQIVVSTGAKQSLANVILSVVNPGDEVIIPTPYWVTYADLASLAQGNIKYLHCPLDQGFKLTPAQLEAAITPKTRLFLYSSPCNPSGTVYSREELAALAEVFKKHPQVLIISDEIYEYINYEGEHASLAQFGFLKDRMIIVNGMSKGFAMTGWRVGYIAAPLPIAKACDKIQSQMTSGTCSIAQRASLAALSSDLKPTKDMVAEFHRRRGYMLAELKKLPGLKVCEPGGAFYLFPDVSAYFGKSAGTEKIENADDFCMYLLHQAHVSTVTGTAFGEPDCIRISYANSMENLEKAIGRIATALSNLT